MNKGGCETGKKVKKTKGGCAVGRKSYGPKNKPTTKKAPVKAKRNIRFIKKKPTVAETKPRKTRSDKGVKRTAKAPAKPKRNIKFVKKKKVDFDSLLPFTFDKAYKARQVAKQGKPMTNEEFNAQFRAGAKGHTSNPFTENRGKDMSNMIGNIRGGSKRKKRKN